MMKRIQVNKRTILNQRLDAKLSHNIKIERRASDGIKSQLG